MKRTALIHLAREYASHAKFANLTWPFVTLPDFSWRTDSILELADVIGLFLLPLVTNENLKEWGEFTVDNQQWFWDGLESQQRKYGNTTTDIPDQWEEHEEYLSVDGDVIQMGTEGPNGDFYHIASDDPGPFFPAWQFAREYTSPTPLGFCIRYLLTQSPFPQPKYPSPSSTWTFGLCQTQRRSSTHFSKTAHQGTWSVLAGNLKLVLPEPPSLICSWRGGKVAEAERVMKVDH